MPAKLEKAGMCVYCGMPAVDSCQICGALVCAMHFNKSAGSCTKCLGGRRVR